MANQYTALKIPSKTELEDIYKEGFTQEEIGKKFNTTQKVVFSWFKKLGIKSRKAFKRNQWGKKNHMWKGELSSYQAHHHWVEKQLGKPNLCQHCGKTKKLYRGYFEWANIGHTYKRNLLEWIRLCRKCHRKLDKGKITPLELWNFLLE